MSFPWTLYIVTAVLSMIWAATEVTSAFEVAPIRALFTMGAWLLMLANAAFACLALMIILEIVPNAENSLLTAFAVGLGWQALVRSQISVIRPLPGGPTGRGLVVPLDEIYGRIQHFVRRSIDQSLARDRMKLLEQALTLDLEVMKRQVQLMSYGLTEMDPEAVREWMYEMDSRQMPDDERKMLLASKLIEVSGVRGLKQLIESQKQQAKQTASPAEQSTVVPDGQASSPIEPAPANSMDRGME